MFSFECIYRSKKSKARVGRIFTPHGIIDTPSFVAVGTNGTIKALDSAMVDALGLQLMFCNTYHLLLHPGTEVVAAAGGLHHFINRSLPLITDSGGFQVFSLMYGGVHDELKSSGQKKERNLVLKVTEEGVHFRSYRNGDLINLTPESTIQAQKKLGADIIIPLDELPPYHIDLQKLERSLHRTHRWEKRSLDEHMKNRNGQAIYSVVHGGLDPAMRTTSARLLGALDFDGHAIGGSLGKTRQQMFDMLDYTVSLLPHEKPNHLLGIGDLHSMEEIIKRGIDTFDSSYPTKCARHGMIFTFSEVLKIEKSTFQKQFSPLEKGCGCYTCTHYTAAYVHHLFKAYELTAYTLATIHNLYHMVERMKRYRHAILNGEL